jgi:broad-specificity NMP kinase
MWRILLTGIPGTGKTTLGAYLGVRHRFEHLDFERKTDIDRFLVRGEQGCSQSSRGWSGTGRMS